MKLRRRKMRIKVRHLDQGRSVQYPIIWRFPPIKPLSAKERAEWKKSCRRALMSPKSLNKLRENQHCLKDGKPLAYPMRFKKKRSVAAVQLQFV